MILQFGLFELSPLARASRAENSLLYTHIG